MKVYLDFGHGGSDSGAVGGGLKEADINLKVGLKVKAKLEYCGISVKTSRTSNISVSLSGRVEEANKYKANCFVSIHCNSAESTSAQGIETFSYKATTSDLAKLVHEELVKTKAYTKNRGVKTANFYVIKNTNMRSCLVELAFISNSEDRNILSNKQDVLAEAIAKGICKYLGVAYKEEVIAETNKLYRVCVGAYSSKDNANKQLEEAKKKGFKDAYIVE